MGKKDKEQQNKYSQKSKVEAVLQLVRKQSPLTLKQEKYCNPACVERFLKAKGENVKKAARQLRSCLSWRDSIGTENLIADEFSAELAEGVAYVAGHDDESRPVMIFRVKQDYHKFHSQKMITRLVVFTMEVAIQTMPKNVQQFVLLFDASLFRSASAFMNILLATLKMMAEYYPGRLYKAFVIDPPSLFSYLWKGVRPFVELSNVMSIVSSMDYMEDSFEFSDISCYPTRASSLRFDPSSVPLSSYSTTSSSSSNKVGPSASSRFSFTVNSHHFDSLKPWYLSLTDTSSSKVDPTPCKISTPTLGPALISPVNARSFSFASPNDRTPRLGDRLVRKNFIPSTPLPQKSYNADAANVKQPRTPKTSFLHTPTVMSSLFSRKDAMSSSQSVASHMSKTERMREAFVPYLKFYRRPYDEMIYRSKMKPPLGGLISIVAPQIRRSRNMSVSQRF